VPNEYVMTIANKNPDIFFPIISIHPYREDATTALRHYAQQGVRFVKWLPNAMGIHPASATMQDKLDPYYRIMREHDMVLISHTGLEAATEAEKYQRYGNPLLLKKPLDMGVKVVMAHVASLGECEKEEAAICSPGTPYVDLAIQMLEDPEYAGLVFADISALTQYNRHHNLDKILAKPSIHSRLINGSDYPLPAINIVIQTRSLVSSGHINSEERDALNEIYDYNPLLFDFVLKRTLRHSTTGAQFPPSVFIQHTTLPTD
jgi:mannonate dehydratase